ncbi:MAG TPA: hypothetical protein VFC00_01195 [Micromonosporaceae bacterium]|nr:hypothetical protein [Micromonosporaceae bacterium]
MMSGRAERRRIAASRAQAGTDLARWADHPLAATQLLRLVLDPADTGVTSHALLRRNDLPGVRLLAAAVADADDEPRPPVRRRRYVLRINRS